MKSFYLIWIGQLVSAVGSQISSFTLGLWVYQNTDSVGQFAIVLTLIYFPGILVSPMMGILIDQMKPRLAMIVSDLGAAISTLAIILLASIGKIGLWQVYSSIILSSVFSSLQWSAYATTISVIVPQSNLHRANGMVEISKASAKLIAPFAAGLLLVKHDLRSVLTLDLLSFCFSLLTLAIVKYPGTQAHLASQSDALNHNSVLWLRDLKIAGEFIFNHPLLSRLTLLFFYLYLNLGVLEAVITPLILSIASPAQLGMVLSLGGCGWLLGSVLASSWRVSGINLRIIPGFMILQGFLLFLGGLRPSLTLASIGIIGYLFAYPFISTVNQTIWQLEVPTPLQGRVFSVRLMAEWTALPMGYLLSGLLVEQLFEPLLLPGGELANTVGHIMGTGPGRGIGFLFVLLGLSTILVAVSFYFLLIKAGPYLRRIRV